MLISHSIIDLYPLINFINKGCQLFISFVFIVTCKKLFASGLTYVNEVHKRVVLLDRIIAFFTLFI